MRASFAAVVCFAGSVLLTSCLTIPVPERMSGGSGDNLGWKVVADKRDPNLLYAADGTECTVGRDKFESVRRGERVFCRWRRLARPPLGTALRFADPAGRSP